MHLLTAIFCLVVACSCSPATPETDSATAPEGAFVPSPQQIPEQEVRTLEIGSPAPDFNLPGVDGRYHRLADFADAEVLVVVFTANHCPTAQAYEDRIKAIARDYSAKNVDLVAISPNSPLGLLLEELGYSDMGDDFEDMQIRAEYLDYNFPYLYDGDNQAVSLRYGPVATPHVFVFDRDRILRYRGRIDGSEKPGTGNGQDLRSAIDAILDGRDVEQPVTKAFGCSTKWAWKNEWMDRVNREWHELPVELHDIDSEGIQKLLANDSGKLRLINVWATWCGPCVIEYPELIKIHRMYKERDFEFVSLSADSLDHREDVLQFLRERESAVSNHIFSEDDPYKMIEAVDPNWDGALPYTLLVEPGGKVVYSHMGPIDPLEVKRAIVDHPLIGRYY